METLGHALPKEQKRVRELLGVYIALGPNGAYGALKLEQALQQADKAVMSSDLVEMLQSYKQLKDCK